MFKPQIRLNVSRYLKSIYNQKCYHSTFLDHIHAHSEIKTKKITIDDLIYSQKLTYPSRTKLVHQELKNRIAKKIREIEEFPYGLGQMPSIKRVEDWYLQSFKELVQVENTNPEYFMPNNNYDKILDQIYHRHSSTMINMSKGIFEWKSSFNKKYNLNEEESSNFFQKSKQIIEPIEQALNNFYWGRISIRMILQHYLSLLNENDKENESNIALVDPSTKPLEIIKNVYSDISYMCDREYGRTPDILINNQSLYSSDNLILENSLTIPYIPSNLYYVIFEVLKNSARATMENFPQNKEPQPIQIVLSQQETNTLGKSNLVIKISDKGEGISYENLNNVWSYFYTTSKKNIYNLSSSDEIDDLGKEVPIAGFGHGLPLSRLHLRYFDGNITINSMKGIGTDLYLYI